MSERFYSFNRYLRERFKERVHRINLDAGFTCPNLDGTLSRRGCVYCDNRAFSPYARAGLPLKEQINRSIDFYSRRMGVKKFIAYFQAFSGTYGDLPALERAYAVVRAYPQIVGLFISTRPDCVDPDKLDLIAAFKKDYLVWIEYGLQTTHDDILRALNRGHNYGDFLKALELTRARQINVGVHMILCLPGHTRELIVQDARRLCGLDIQGIKFHALHVLKGTDLEKAYAAGRVVLPRRDDYVSAVCDFIEQIPPHVVILRLVSSALKDCLVAPEWLGDKTAAIAAIRAELERRGTRQGNLIF